MIKNFLLVAFRNLGRNKIYVAINTLGMGIALTCCLSAYLIIAYNIEFDGLFRSDITSRRLFKIMHQFEQSNGERYEQLTTPIVMAPIAATEATGVIGYVRYCSSNGTITFAEDSFSENIHFADASIFTKLSFPLRHGALKNFDNQSSVFISEKLRQKYFGEGSGVGELLSINFKGKTFQYSVGGVFDHIPLNSTFIPDVLLRIENYLDADKIGPDDWENPSTASVVLELSADADPLSVEKQINTYHQRLNSRKTDVRSISFHLLPFDEPLSPNDVRLTYFHLQIPVKALVIFGILAGIIMLIACFNLANTTLAMTIRRLREIGVRKVIGSSRSQIVYQFLIEVVITVLFAIAAGLCMSLLIVPEFAAMWGLEYSIFDLDGLNLILALIVIVILIALLAGTYPAISTSGYNPVNLFRSHRTQKSSFITRIMLITQFALSTMVLIAGVVFTQNEGYQQQIDFGYDKEKVITVTIEDKKDFDRIRQSIQNMAQVETVSAAANSFSDFGSYRMPVKVDALDVTTNIYAVAPNYFETMGMELISGRDFREEIPADTLSVVVDENFVAENKLVSPIGTRIEYQHQFFSIIGVVSNHIDGLMDRRSDKKDHLFLKAHDNAYKVMLIRCVNEDQLSDLQSNLHKKWNELAPGRVFDSKTQQQIVFDGAGQYNRNLKKIFLFLTILGCLLSASGIYALARLSVQRRMKEIGIRKVFGAGLTQILLAVNRQFIVIVVVATIVGGFAGSSLTRVLLNDLYAHHIQLNALIVVISALVVFLVGVSVTSGAILGAALANPKDTLRND